MRIPRSPIGARQSGENRISEKAEDPGGGTHTAHSFDGLLVLISPLITALTGKIGD